MALAKQEVARQMAKDTMEANKRFAGLIPGRNLFARLSDALHRELAWRGQPLWLHRP